MLLKGIEKIPCPRCGAEATPTAIQIHIRGQAKITYRCDCGNLFSRPLTDTHVSEWTPTPTKPIKPQGL